MLRELEAEQSRASGESAMGKGFQRLSIAATRMTSIPKLIASSPFANLWELAPAPSPLSPEPAQQAEAETWPEMDAAAYHGLAGDIVRAIEPHREADPAGLLTQ